MKGRMEGGGDEKMHGGRLWGSNQERCLQSWIGCCWKRLAVDF